MHKEIWGVRGLNVRAASFVKFLKVDVREKEAQSQKIETAQGHYGDYYQAVYESITENKPSPVNPYDVVWQLQVIQAAFDSSRTNTLQLID